jgi:hypothetical protein
MTQAARKLTFEEYINLDAEDWVQLGLPEGRCEYVDGELNDGSINEFEAVIGVLLLETLEVLNGESHGVLLTRNCIMFIERSPQVPECNALGCWQAAPLHGILSAESSA